MAKQANKDTDKEVVKTAEVANEESKPTEDVKEKKKSTKKVTEPKIGSKNKDGAVYMGKGMWIKK